MCVAKLFQLDTSSTISTLESGRCCLLLSTGKTTPLFAGTLINRQSQSAALILFSYSYANAKCLQFYTALAVHLIVTQESGLSRRRLNNKIPVFSTYEYFTPLKNFRRFASSYLFFFFNRNVYWF
jgi:hypothetical protein